MNAAATKPAVATNGNHGEATSKELRAYDIRLSPAAEFAEKGFDPETLKIDHVAEKKLVRKLYMPLLRPNLEPRPLPELAKLDADAIQGYAPTFACRKCHRIENHSLWRPSAWNKIIALREIS